MYLFLAIPNFCGSTLIHSVLETVPEVVPLIAPTSTTKFYGGKTDFVEGNICAGQGYKNLYGPHSIEANMEHVYSNPANYNWNYIKGKWHENWANSNPYGTIYMQKTPADIFRISQMLPYFPDCKWIVSVREPYSYVESIMRKATFYMDPFKQLDQICFHVLRVMELQIYNARLLASDAYVMTLEDFINDPSRHVNELSKLVPELSQINLSSQLMIKGKLATSIHNEGPERIKRLTEIDGLVDRINEYFTPLESIINHWGYKLQTEKDILQSS